MCFGTTHILSQVNNLTVGDESNKVELVQNMKYVGVILDSKLTFRDHVQYVRGKSISRLKMLGKTRPLVSSETSLQLYKTLITPLFDYAAPAYDCLTQKDSYTLQKVQNCALRIILKCDRRSHIKDMHQTLKLHYLSDRRHMLTLNQVYKCVNGLAPLNLCSQITLHRDVQIRQTRASAGLDAVIPRLNLETSRKAFKYRGPWYWNLIDDSIRGAGTIDTFKRNLYKSDTFAPV